MNKRAVIPCVSVFLAVLPLSCAGQENPSRTSETHDAARPEDGLPPATREQLLRVGEEFLAYFRSRIPGLDSLEDDEPQAYIALLEDFARKDFATFQSVVLGSRTEKYTFGPVFLNSPSAFTGFETNFDGRFPGRSDSALFSALSFLACEGDCRLKGADSLPSAAQIEEEVHRLASRYPSRARTERFGTSHQGRPLTALHIRERGLGADAPVIWLGANIHANEPIGTEVVLRLAERILERGIGAGRFHFVIIPMQNPDGREHSRLKASSRKNMFTDEKTGMWIGVDLNRNFPIAPGERRESDPFDGSFAGFEPASEPETAALMTLAKRLEPAYAIDFHSAESFTAVPKPLDDAPRYRRLRDLCDSVAEGLGRLANQEHTCLPVQDVTQGIYTGLLTEWMWRSFGTFALGVELQAPYAPGWPDATQRALEVERGQWVLDTVLKDAMSPKGNPQRNEAPLQ